MPAPHADYRITTMSKDELGIAIDWAGAEGWNPGLGDVACFHAADTGGFFLGRIGDRPVATISAVRYGDDFGFVGLYIVDAHHRGHGCGIRIWNHALNHLRGRVVGLDGVVAQQDNYRKSGFVFAHRNIRFAGTLRTHVVPSRSIVDLARVDRAMLAEADRQFFPAPRDAFLREWIAQPQAHSVALIDGRRLRGYGTIRQCRSGYKIGPLNADDPEVAAELFDALGARVPAGSVVFLDVPEPNAAAVAFAGDRAMTPTFETARMYAGGRVELPLERIFGITTLELG